MNEKHTNNYQKKVSVRFYSYGDSKTCYAEATLPVTNRVIKGIRVNVSSGKIFCDMPLSLKDKWYFKEMRWEQVAAEVVSAFRKMQRFFSAPVSEKEDAKPRLSVTEPEFVFTKPEKKKCAFAQIAFHDTTAVLKDIYVQADSDGGSVYVSPPKMLESSEKFDWEQWNIVASVVSDEFKRQILGEEIEIVTDTDVVFDRVEDFSVCFGDVYLPKQKAPIKGFKLKLFSNGRVEVKTPKTIGIWKNPKYSWDKLRTDISEALKKELHFVPERNAEENGGETAVKPKIKKEYTYYGRVANAAHSDFVYYPHSMLRPDTDVEGVSKKKNLSVLATALDKGTKGGIGQFEINALWWVSKLRYMTGTMLQDLAAHGYVSFGWRENVSSKKLGDITRRMSEYNMITKSRFCCLDEDGNEIESSKSIARIMTLAPNGSTLLRELGKEVNIYNPFTVLQDGNTVKRYLVANQWLIYWLRAYKERVGENYESAVLLQQKGAQFTVARIYASVTVDGVTMVAEPIRRVGEFEVKENKRLVLNKLGRMIQMFRNLDQLYCYNQKIDFPSRPVIVLLCEDDEHIKEVLEMLSELMKDNPQQEFWFSTDLRVFNMEYIGQRFLKAENGELKVVSMADYFGRDDEIEKEKLIRKFVSENEASCDDADNPGFDDVLDEYTQEDEDDDGSDEYDEDAESQFDFFDSGFADSDSDDMDD